MSERRRAAQRVQDALAYAESIIATLREPFVVLDSLLRVQMANAAFYRTFQVLSQDTETRFLYELGNGQWNVPRLRMLLSDALPDHSGFHGIEIERSFPVIGQKIMLLNGRRVAAADGVPDFILLAIEDITERRRAEATMRASEMRYRRLFESAHDGILILDADTGAITDANPFMSALLGYAQDEFIGKALWQIGLFDDIEANRRAFRDLQAQGYIRYDHLPLQSKDGQLVEVEFVSNLYQVDERRVIQCNIRDITERTRAERQIAQLAHFDSLTGLANRSQLKEELARAIAVAHRHRRRLAVMFIDLDRFKNINDTLGHEAGDHLLKEIAGRLRGQVRETDTVARPGGDEFVIVLTEVAEAEDAAVVGRNILTSVSGPINLGGQMLVVGASIGISLYPDDGTDAETLLRHADGAMYHAKEEGKNKFSFHTARLAERVRHKLTVEASLRLALDRQEFFLAYQPIVDHRGAITAAEALLRWRHPAQGVVLPGEFIPVAEETGLIVLIGEWALRAACSQAQAWRAAGANLSLSVNLSPQQLRRPAIVRTVREILAATGLASARLELEVTESALMLDTPIVLEILKGLKALGVTLAIDDFGTGYAALTYLKRFPIDTLKIDQSFVQDIGTDPNDRVIVEAIMAMAKALHLRVVAEGVETETQLALLKARDCTEYQGYLFSPPVTAEAFEDLLREWAERPTPPQGHSAASLLLHARTEKPN